MARIWLEDADEGEEGIEREKSKLKMNEEERSEE